MVRDITFGQYIDSKSFIHRLDPRIKILLLILLLVVLFLCNGFISLGSMFLATVIIMVASKVSFKLYLKNFKVILPIIILTSLLNLFFTKTGVEYHLFLNVSIFSDGIFKAVFMSLRLVLLIVLSSVLTYTTTPNDITDAMERLLSPLRFIGLGNAVHTFSMMMTIALRFIPTLIEETDKIMNAQKARGADLESGGLVRRIKALLPILIPLLISSVRRAYELAEAMESRCYNGGKGRTRMKQMKLVAADVFAFALTLILSALLIFVSFYFKW